MADTALTSRLRDHRARAGLSQQELAHCVGVSRQAVVAIEAGRSVPSTALALQLASALRCTVEDLFAVASGSTLVLRVPVDSRVHGRDHRYVAGCVDGQWVGHPVADRDRPADAVATEQLRASGTVVAKPLCEIEQLEQNVLVAGCAPLLGVLAARVGRRHHHARATWIPANSSRALALLEAGLVHVAGMHLADAANPWAHVQAAQRAVGSQRATLINFARWQQGLVVAPGNPLAFDASPELWRHDARWVRRDLGSGAQTLLSRLWDVAGFEALDGPIATDHAEVAKLVRWGVADVGVAIEAVALAEGLDFIPLAEERFDLVVPNARLDTRAVARVFDLIDSPTFRTEAAQIPGYDLSLAGHASTIAANS